MTSRLDSIAQLSHRPLLMTAVVAGDPFVEASFEHMSALVEGGADLIELILPFSDPAFHGPVIQRACQRALREHIPLELLAQHIAAWRSSYPDVPLIVSSYFNRFLATGIEEGASLMHDCGVDGLSFLDLPWREARLTMGKLAKQNIVFIPAISPTTPRARVEEIAQEFEGGVAIWTGHVGAGIEDRVGLLATLTEHVVLIDERLSLIASMSVSTPEQARAVAETCGGVLIGSSIIWIIEGRNAEIGTQLGQFVHRMRQGVDAASSHVSPRRLVPSADSSSSAS